MENQKTVDKENKKKNNLWDYLVACLVALTMLVLYFFWGCKWDLPATILCLVVVIVGTLILRRQVKKLNEEDEEKSEATVEQ